MLLVSEVRSDGTIIETVYDPHTNTTSFAISDNTGIQIIPEWSEGDDTFVPVRPTNNLLRHHALLLPSTPSEFGSIDVLIEAIEQYVNRYVSLTEEARALSIAYVLLTWVFDAFNELPYLRFRGDYGTGKTRALLVIGSICYKAFFASGASTVSPIFHTLDTFGGTLIFDEADFRFSDEKAELVKILNNGNARGFPVLRTHVTPKREFDPRAFSIFGPKIVAMRRSYEDRALESRFLTIEMQSGSNSIDVPINLPDDQKAEARTLRDKLLCFRLRTRTSVALDHALASSALEPRMNQILLPLLSVCTNDTMRQVIHEFGRSVQSRIMAERSTSTEGDLLLVLAEFPERDRLSLATIVDRFIAAHGSDYERPVSNRWIASVLRRLGINLYKSNGISVIAPGQDTRLSVLFDRYGVNAVLREPGS